MRGVAVAAALAAVLATPLALRGRATDVPGRALAPAGRGTFAPRTIHAAPTDQIDVSRNDEAQAEVAVAADPSSPNVLVAGSNSLSGDIAVYDTTDGGATWTSSRLPEPRRLCSYGDPALAVDATGRQYYAFLAGGCFQAGTLRVVLALASRPGPTGAWTSRAIKVPGATSFNDKESIAVDVSPASPRRGRLYLAWSRLVAGGDLEIALAHSDDAGATWSRAVKVSGAHATAETYPTVGVGADGTVYVAWLTLDQHVFLDRSTDGGDRFGRDLLVVTAAQIPVGACHFGGTAIPAQPRRCIASAPLLAVDRTSGRVYVTYGAAGPSGREQNVYVSSYDGATLAPLVRERQINPPDAGATSDQFFAASTVDQTTERLWACWYDTTGDPARKRTRYTCSASGDGGVTWAAPVPAASVYSNETVRQATSFEYGDYAGLAVAGGVAHPMWTDSRDLAKLGEEIYTTALQLP